MHKNNNKIISNLDKLSFDVYNDRKFALSYAEKISYNSHNALYERPAVVSLLPDIKEKKVLDAGCGPGALTAELSDKGAFVTAVDFSNEMLAIAKEKSGPGVRFVKANLNAPLDFLNDEEFDLIVSSLVIHYIKDLRSLFSEFNRVLKPGGMLIASTHHPFMDFSFHPESNYFETELLTDDWPAYNIKMEFFRRPLSELFNMFSDADFRIEEIIEPLPSDECRVKYPDTYKILSSKPWFIIFKSIKER